MSCSKCFFEFKGPTLENQQLRRSQKPQRKLLPNYMMSYLLCLNQSKITEICWDECIWWSPMSTKRFFIAASAPCIWKIEHIISDVSVLQHRRQQTRRGFWCPLLSKQHRGDVLMYSTRGSSTSIRFYKHKTTSQWDSKIHAQLSTSCSKPKDKMLVSSQLLTINHYLQFVNHRV